MNTLASPRRFLEPVERVAEILFGLIMVLSITSSIGAAEGGPDGVRTVLLAALGCNFAWGVIDALLYLMGCLAERGRALMTLIAVRRSDQASQARLLVAEALPPLVASVLHADELEAIRQRLLRLPEPARPARLAKDDYLGALGVFLLVFLSTFPIVIPFLLIADVRRALYVSNAIGIVLMFLTGQLFGRASGRSPWGMALLMVVLGVLLVAFTKMLGG